MCNGCAAENVVVVVFPLLSPSQREGEDVFEGTTYPKTHLGKG